MCQLYFFIATILAKPGDAVPQPPWDFSLFPCSSRGEKDGAGRLTEKTARPFCCLQASDRRSGCVPAEPYPPLKHHQPTNPV